MVARHRVFSSDANDIPEPAEPRRGPTWPMAPIRAVIALVRPRSIRAKLARVLAVSLLLVFIPLGLLVTDQIDAFSAASRTTRTVTVVLSVQDAVHQLQRERGLTNGLLSGDSHYRPQVLTQRTQTDIALTALNRTIDDPGNADAGAAAVRSALTNLGQLAAVRAAVDNAQALPAPTFQFYTETIATLDNLDLGLDQTQDETLRRGLQVLYALGTAKENAGQERGLLNGVFSSGHFTADNYLKFTQILGEKRAAMAEFNRLATAGERRALTTVLNPDAANQAAGYEATAIGGASGATLTPIDPQAWWNAMTAVVDDMRDVQRSVGADITHRATQLRDMAALTLAGILLLAVLAAAVMVMLVLNAARSVIGPLSALARDAEDLSSRRLPDTVAALLADDEAEVASSEPVTSPVGASSEISRVAHTLEQVRTTAISLAVEQARLRRNTSASLASLARRNQNLVRRQLGLISELERDELDPTALSNMFQLDHLATRMRRNAESLLVLVGDTSPRPSAEPMPVADVIRAALSEVEDYQRAVLRRVDDAYINGAVVAEVAHMLAELVENGLSFSPPDMEVEIYGRRMADSYLLVVVDYGVGMSAAELAKAQVRLRDQESYLVAPTRFLGHYVVGRLAHQLSAQVELSNSPVTGITARILLPSAVLAPTPSRTSPVTSTGSFTSTSSIAIRTPAPNGRNTAMAVAPRPIPAPITGPITPVNPTHNGSNGHSLTTVSGAMTVDAPITGERTRNGLLKRQPKARTAGTRPPATGRPPGTDIASKDRSPTEVARMLSAFRRGHQRGELETTGSDPVTDTAGEARPALEEGRRDH